jgi:hypothetical protein
MLIRKSVEADLAAMLAIVNDAAQAYRGVIPADRWHEPYMPMDELVKEIASGIVFWVAEEEGRLNWSIPARQIETSVVLADGRWAAAQQRASADG